MKEDRPITAILREVFTLFRRSIVIGIFVALIWEVIDHLSGSPSHGFSHTLFSAMAGSGVAIQWWGIK